MSIQKAFDDFLATEFESAVDRATQASWGGNSVFVELFPDGIYRVLNSVGNLYDSPGLLLKVPALRDDEWDEDPNIRYYDDAREHLAESYTEAKLP